jgi:hypothetical protein
MAACGMDSGLCPYIEFVSLDLLLYFSHTRPQTHVESHPTHKQKRMARIKSGRQDNVPVASVGNSNSVTILCSLVISLARAA